MEVLDGARLAIEGWEGGGQVDGLAQRLHVGRRRQRAASEGELRLPMVFAREVEIA